ncbi:TetR/AcrR family transcriptional regulator [Pelagibacterium halotolerans]|uniref:Putative transcriptional regulator, TetR family n=1 Tax=Pelagibacterium halotolerans (strain DSM 22347 / JCM 15775 / CGMCC 1.7692 / B2) TaxID=1082931 RepID=G4RBV7_PELHB|nr:TetR/AcrR family transcriptional regulator [Pelagibacterium halotolerans]AEQ50620.1 putative transcriptional regulator, TetR family [Pelagibacterium halotolerans B2]QJR19441.1 TetR/AcrR family transcriptional regulator [Pelagibacterium halotolerans]SDZ91254.1 transcriptional regulator, TetR family [Pelagibacterium halotolerans]
MSSPSPRVLEKRRRILEAAQAVMLRTGLRAATMEAIAKAAGIAKPTLYAQFSDKDAVFDALIDDLVCDKSETFARAFDIDAPLDERVGNAMAEMYGSIADMLEGSPHAAELVSEPHRLGRKFKEVDDAILARLAGAFSDAGIEEPERLATMLLASGSGILAKFPDGSAVRAAIRLLCERVIRGSFRAG